MGEREGPQACPVPSCHHPPCPSPPPCRSFHWHSFQHSLMQVHLNHSVFSVSYIHYLSLCKQQKWHNLTLKFTPAALTTYYLFPIHSYVSKYLTQGHNNSALAQLVALSRYMVHASDSQLVIGAQKWVMEPFSLGRKPFPHTYLLKYYQNLSWVC